MRELLVVLDIYTKRNSAAGPVIRRKRAFKPKWAWLRKNRGSFDSEPRDRTKSVTIRASGRGDWIGWVELAVEPMNEIGIRMSAKVIKEVNADIIGIVEAEDRPSLKRFNDELLGKFYHHVMLIDGNDTRGIDVGIMTKQNFDIQTMRSHVDTKDTVGTVFSRDCPQYTVQTPSGVRLHVLVNHFKSQSGGGGPKRRRQAVQLRKIADELTAAGEHVVVLGDFNEGPRNGTTQAENLAALYTSNGGPGALPLVDCFSLVGFDTGARPGTYGSCSLRNRLDYIFISQSLVPHFAGGEVMRKGLWGTRITRPDKWSVYQEINKSLEQASDHAALYVDLNI